ncbi:MAG TPA: serine hydrolase domain-containing protein [Vicinamibacterales bacterium]|nr:serine hydrolase domain-containing protein [Vicinamibacterales bacterium]
MTLRTPRSAATRIAAAVALALLIDGPLTGQSAPTRPEDVGLSSGRLQRVTDAFRAYVEDGRLPGAVVLIARRGKIAYLEAFGHRDREAAAPMHPETIFRIASQTKAVVSVGVMILQEEGRLLVGDTVARYLPAFAKTTVAVPAASAGAYDVVPAKRPITIRDLLTHTAGIGYGQGTAADRWKEAGIQGWYFADRSEPIAETVDRMAALPFDAQPGERWVYGYATDILGALIERVSGEPLDAFLRSRIFTPLGMRSTQFYLPDSKRDRLAVVYSARGSGIERAPETGGMLSQGAYASGPRRSFSGGAGLLSTAPDYARFLQMLLNGGDLDGVRILSRASVRLMTVDHLNGIAFRPGQGFGLGFSIVKDLGARGVPGSDGEYSWGGAYHSTFWVDPAEQLIVVYMTQLIPADGLDDHGKLRALVYQAIVDGQE